MLQLHRLQKIDVLFKRDCWLLNLFFCSSSEKDLLLWLFLADFCLGLIFDDVNVATAFCELGFDCEFHPVLFGCVVLVLSFFKNGIDRAPIFSSRLFVCCDEFFEILVLRLF
jgi:hypothetical protein